jgi:hypothetical protein
MTRINVDNARLPGVQSESTAKLGNEMARSDVFANGVYVGQVVYIARRRKAPAGSASSTGFVTDYGWRPAQVPAQSKLTNKVDAILRLPQMATAQ